MSNDSVLTLCSRHDDIIAARIHLVLFQRPRRWPPDVLAAQVVLSVVTGAPNLFRVGAILNDAFQMGAHRGKSFQIARGRAYENSRLVSELEDLPGIHRHLAQLGGHH